MVLIGKLSSGDNANHHGELTEEENVGSLRVFNIEGRHQTLKQTLGRLLDYFYQASRCWFPLPTAALGIQHLVSYPPFLVSTPLELVESPALLVRSPRSLVSIPRLV